MSYFISVIIPAYNEENSIPELYRQIMLTVREMQKNNTISQYELVFVNDGSTDATESVMLDLHEKDANVHVISLRRNFGKATALNAGLRHVNGDIIFTIDADLQDAPKEFPRFIAKLFEGYDLVVGWKANRLDSIEKRLPSKLFNKVTSNFSGVNLHDHDCGFKAFRRDVADSLDLYGELHRYIPVLAHRQGFRITEIPVEHHKREFGRSKYGVERYLRGLFDFLTTIFLIRYSDRPMYFFGKIGLLCLTVGLAICSYLTVIWFMGNPIGGRPLLVLGVLLILLGIQFISTGFIGNLLVDITHRDHYREDYIKKIV
jgi:glycosyltransferase involved in cell wall biosynthesis